VHNNNVPAHKDSLWCYAPMQYHVRQTQVPFGMDEVAQGSGVLVAKIPVGNIAHMFKMSLFAISLPTLCLLYILNSVYETKYAAKKRTRAAVSRSQVVGESDEPSSEEGEL
jgi:hypothetical protein